MDIDGAITAAVETMALRPPHEPGTAPTPYKAAKRASERSRSGSSPAGSRGSVAPSDPMALHGTSALAAASKQECK